MKVRYAWLVAAAYGVIALQGALIGRAGLGTFAPDLTFILVVFLALRAPAYPALIVSWSLGLAKDATGGGPLGAWAVLFLGAAAIILGLRDKFFIQKALTQVLLAGVAAMVVDVAYLLGRWAFHRGTSSLGRAMLFAAAGALVTAALTPVLVRLFGRFRLVRAE